MNIKEMLLICATALPIALSASASAQTVTYELKATEPSNNNFILFDTLLGVDSSTHAITSVGGTVEGGNAITGFRGVGSTNPFLDAASFNSSGTAGFVTVDLLYGGPGSGSEFALSDFSGRQYAEPCSFGNCSVNTLDEYNATVSLAIVPTAAVPETATWVMMIGGFGLAGWALRRRQRQHAHLSFDV